MKLCIKRPSLPYVLWLPLARRLLGQWGPWVLGMFSNAPAELRAEWLGQ